MNQSMRAVVAYVAARHVTGQNTSCIRDVQQGAYVMLTGSMGAEAVNIHDHAARCQIIGTRNPRNGNHYELTHQGQGVLVILDFDGGSFRGSVNDESFSGAVEGRGVRVEDGEGKFEFSL